MTEYATICLRCGAEASIVALGTMSGWQEVEVVMDGDKPTARLVGRIESDGYNMDVDEYQCCQCEATDFRFEKLVKVIHPWSEEWLRIKKPATEGSDGEQHHRGQARLGGEAEEEPGGAPQGV